MTEILREIGMIARALDSISNIEFKEYGGRVGVCKKGKQEGISITQVDGELVYLN